MTNIDPVNLVTQAEAYAVGEADADFRQRLDSYLHHVHGAGWTPSVSQLLDPNGASRRRKAAWWLLESGATVCGLGVPAKKTSDAIAARTAVSSVAEPEPGVVDVLAYDDGVYCLQVLDDAQEFDLAELPEEKLIPLASLTSDTTLVYLPAKERCFEVQATRDSDESLLDHPEDYFRVHDSSPVEIADDLSIVDKAGLSSIPPCPGACIGTTAMVLMSALLEETRFSPQSRSTVHSKTVDHLRMWNPELVEQLSERSGHISSVNWGGRRYLHLNPSGMVHAAALLRRFGNGLSTETVLKPLENWRSRVTTAIGKMDMAAKWARLNKGILPPVFEESPDEWQLISDGEP